MVHVELTSATGWLVAHLHVLCLPFAHFFDSTAESQRYSMPFSTRNALYLRISSWTVREFLFAGLVWKHQLINAASPAVSLPGRAPCTSDICPGIVLSCSLYRSQVHWMTDQILQAVLADLRPKLAAKFREEQPSKKSTVEVHRGGASA